jgi:hypothetical protein
MPEAPTDPLNRVGQALACQLVAFGPVGPTLGRLSGMLDPQREVEPVQDMMRRSRTGGFAKRAQPVGAIGQA